jgi:hypothetical protein
MNSMMDVFQRTRSILRAAAGFDSAREVVRTGGGTGNALLVDDSDPVSPAVVAVWDE